MPELKTKLKEYRAKLDMKQGDLAEKVGVRRETIIRLEKGQYNPSLKLAMDIAKVFGVSVEDIFSFEDEKSLKYSKADGLQDFGAEKKHILKMQIQTYKHIF